MKFGKFRQLAQEHRFVVYKNDYVFVESKGQKGKKTGWFGGRRWNIWLDGQTVAFAKQFASGQWWCC